MPAMPTIPEPTKFADWKKAGALFDEDGRTTEVHVVNTHDPKVRHAYGRTSDGLFSFFISVHDSEAAEFNRLLEDWRRSKDAAAPSLLLASIATHPPTCGTPNTPPCPYSSDPLMIQPDGSRLA